MKINIGKLLSLTLTIAILLLVVFINTENNTTLVDEIKTENVDFEALQYVNIASNLKFVKKPLFTPQLGKSFTGFKEALGFKESQNDYFRVNQFGYLGKYQFGKSTLRVLGIYHPQFFLSNPELQEKAFIANAQRNKWVLRKDIKRFNNKYIKGVKITESGILAAAHLAGPGSVKKFLRSYGETGFADANGTTIKYYMKKFSGYDTSLIKPLKKVRVKYESA
ncbi:peptidoglycan-binding protein LysM [Olleya sp. Bg11-27]|uniref:peptidoglycan-binding protein LysM n=1 Tax=Olleya sp. Bg11-27 TaxID=2058135 RepID=UPI000C316ADE|nr:peptidoglycan-binding protein LysM [Olleya sp. Bg11-27]AUC76015.1 peptidoglycan-binding protein LysM [Olleya sp. Bg11-27]